jgi:hypothetical protein
VKIEKNKNYKAVGPESLLNYIENKKKNLTQIIPYLYEKQNKSKENNDTEIFLGKKAIFSMLNNLIANGEKGEEYLSFTLVEPHMEEDVIRFYLQYNLRRNELKLDVKVLGNRKVKKIFDEHYTKNLIKKAHVRYSSFNLPQGLIIFQNKVVFLNWQDEPFAVKITNTLMSKQYRDFFLEIYEKAKTAY